MTENWTRRADKIRRVKAAEMRVLGLVAGHTRIWTGDETKKLEEI
jgi:hypothetical protein